LSVFQALALGAVQGLTELLPISSSAHLILIPWFLGWPDHSLTFDVALHVGTLLSIVSYFWRDWAVLLRAMVDSLRERQLGEQPERLLVWLILLGCIPAAIDGCLLEEKVETVFRHSYFLIAADLAVMGAILLWADRKGAKRREVSQMNITDGVVIGIAQAFALIPGVSRSGITITAGLWRGLTREAAARYSFLLGTPIIFGAGVVKLRDLAHGFPPGEAMPFLAGCLASTVVGYLVIHFLLEYLKKGSLAIFAVYRFLIAALVVALALLRGG